MQLHRRGKNRIYSDHSVHRPFLKHHQGTSDEFRTMVMADEEEDIAGLEKRLFNTGENQSGKTFRDLRDQNTNHHGTTVTQ